MDSEVPIGTWMYELGLVTEYGVSFMIKRKAVEA
jgi:hypothetical protein